MIIRRTIDPVMDHKLYEINYKLHGLEKGLIPEIRRPNWMDGSDSEDEDQYSCCSVQNQSENQS